MEQKLLSKLDMVIQQEEVVGTNVRDSLILTVRNPIKVLSWKLHYVHRDLV